MEKQKLSLRQAVIVEGKYDKIKLEALVDALILPTNGFSIFKDAELRTFIKRLAEERGIVILTDSDRAGFQIRSHLTGMIPSEQITNVFIPDLFGKEKRKKNFSAEGKLGVEGMSLDVLEAAFRQAGVLPEHAPTREEPITRLDLYEDGLAGGPDARALRYALYQRLSLPQRLNITAALPLLNNLLTKEEYRTIVAELKSAAEHENDNTME